MNSSVFWGRLSLLLHFELIGRFSLIGANETPQLRLSASTWAAAAAAAAEEEEEEEKPSTATETRTDGGTKWK